MVREFSAGGIVFKGDLVLIRMPAANPEYKAKIGWNFPKGWIEEGESMETAALREVGEEAGVEAKIVKKLATIKYFYKNKDGIMVMKFVTYFQMEWVADLASGFGWETAEILWVTIQEALVLLVNKNERELLEK